MSEEEIKAAEEAAQKRETDLQEMVANLEQDKAGLVEEVKGERVKKQTAQTELEQLKESNTQSPTETDPEELVERVLEKRQVEASKSALEQAKAELKRTHNEYSEQSDAAGILFNKFEDELGKFNLSGLRTKEEYLERFNEVREFMNREKKQESTPSNYQGTPPVGSEAQVIDGATLSDAESKLIQDMNWDKDRYLKVKEKRPAYVASLLKLRG